MVPSNSMLNNKPLMQAIKTSHPSAGKRPVACDGPAVGADPAKPVIVLDWALDFITNAKPNPTRGMSNMIRNLWSWVDKQKKDNQGFSVTGCHSTNRWSGQRGGCNASSGSGKSNLTWFQKIEGVLVSGRWMFQVADGLLVMTRRKFGHGTAMEIDGLTILLTRRGQQENKF